MAEIPVEKKSGGIPWWVWLILALLIAALIWWFVANANDNDAKINDNNVVAEQPMDDMNAVDPARMDSNGGAITSMAGLMGAGAMTGMVGRDVQLTGVPVESLAGDMAFYVGDSSQNRTLVLFKEKPEVPIEKRIDVNPGSMVDLTGTVRAAGDVPAGVTGKVPAGTDAYIYATIVDVKG